MQPERFQLISAVFILLIKDGNIFLSKRQNTGWEDGKYSIVGGHIDGGETATQAAIREAKEETNVDVSPEKLRFFNVCHLVSNTERVQLSFATEEWDGEAINNEPDKAGSAGWFSLDNLPDNLTEISRMTIEWYKNGTSYSEFGWDKKASR